MDNPIDREEGNTPKLYIIHEHDRWLEPLRKSLDALQVPYEEWFVSGNMDFLDLSQEPPHGIFYNRMSPSSHTRGHRYAPEHTTAILSWLEMWGRVVINGSKALDIEMSKVRQMTALQRCGVATPRTIVVTANRKETQAETIKPLLLAAEKHFEEGESFIFKFNRSGRGADVRLFHGVEYLEKFLLNEMHDYPADGIFLLQQYIRPPTENIIRCEFVGQQFLYAVRISTSSGFDLCPADECSAIQNFKTKYEILSDFDSPIISAYIKYMKKFNVHIAGIEFVQDDKDQVFTFDINHNTNYNSAAENRHFGKMVGMPAVAQYLKSVLENAYRPKPALEAVTDHELILDNNIISARARLDNESRYGWSLSSIFG